MTLSQLIARLGLTEVARRAGVSEGTVSGWLRRGLSRKGAETIAGVARRHAASIQAAKSRKSNERFRAQVEPPEEESDIPAEETIPRKAPEHSPEVAALKRAEGIRAGRHTIDSDFNIGYTIWVRVGQDVRDVDESDLISQAQFIFDDSGFDYVSVKFMFLRYIPFNPNYKGEMLRKQGKWHEQWVSTKTASAPLTLSRYMSYYLGHSIEWAETRIIFLEMIGVSVFNRKRELPTADEITSKPMRTTKK